MGASSRLQSVASGLLGAPAFNGGVPIAALGFALHFFIAFAAAAIFYLASRAMPILARHSIIAGLIYGLLIYAVMKSRRAAALRLSAQGVFSATGVGDGALRAHAFYRVANFIGGATGLTREGMIRRGPINRLSRAPHQSKRTGVTAMRSPKQTSTSDF